MTAISWLAWKTCSRSNFHVKIAPPFFPRHATRKNQPTTANAAVNRMIVDLIVFSPDITNGTRPKSPVR